MREPGSAWPGLACPGAAASGLAVRAVGQRLPLGFPSGSPPALPWGCSGLAGVTRRAALEAPYRGLVQDERSEPYRDPPAGARGLLALCRTRPP